MSVPTGVISLAGWGPFPGDSPHSEKSGLFLMLNINKRGVTLDLKTSVGKRMLTELVRQTDVLVESFSPRVMSSLGLSYESLAEANPGLVMVSISNFGQTGPYRDFKASEMVLYGMGGAMHSRGLPGREPVKYGTNVVLYQAGLIGALAAMTGLFARRRRGGDGEHVDVSVFETAGPQQRRALPGHHRGPVHKPGPAQAGARLHHRFRHLPVQGRLHRPWRGRRTLPTSPRHARQTRACRRPPLRHTRGTA